MLMKPTPRIVAFHLLNDFSGSPKVLSQLIHGWVTFGYDIHIYTSLHQQGFLSGIKGVSYHNSWYRFKANKWLRLIIYTLSQIILFFRMLFTLRKTDIVYINTILPFGAALAGKLKGCSIIYHIHESSIRPAILNIFLFAIIKLTANEIINVSKYVQQAHDIKSANNHLIYNAIENTFLEKIYITKKEPDYRNILMVCSLKAYKGVYEFVKLAHDNPVHQFSLVLNATQSEVDKFETTLTKPKNLSIYPSQKNLHPFYRWADLIVNLSRPDGWVETFGLTIIEGMAYGLPAIVPPVGGILEVIEENVTGFSIDSRNTNLLNHTLKKILNDRALYKRLSIAARQRVLLFNEETLVRKTVLILQHYSN